MALQPLFQSFTNTNNFLTLQICHKTVSVINSAALIFLSQGFVTPVSIKIFNMISCQDHLSQKIFMKIFTYLPWQYLYQTLKNFENTKKIATDFYHRVFVLNFINILLRQYLCKKFKKNCQSYLPREDCIKYFAWSSCGNTHVKHKKKKKFK